MPRNKSGSTNGGVIGKTNKTSFGKCTQTVITSDGCHTTQPGTGLVNALLVGGGAGGGNNQGGGGGAGGAEIFNCVSVTGNTAYPIDIGAGGAKNTDGNDTTAFGKTGGKGGSGGTSPVDAGNTVPLGSGGGGSNCGAGGGG